MMPQRVRVLVIAVALFSLPQDLRADEELARHLLDGVFNRREQLISGECRITLSGLDGNGGVEMQDKYFVAFDFAESRWRWDVLESTRPLSSKYLESDGVSWFYDPAAHSLDKNLPGRELIPLEYAPLDLRLVGLTGAGDLRGHSPYEAIKEIISSYSVGSTKDLGDDEVEVVFDDGPNHDIPVIVESSAYVIDVQRLIPVLIESRARRTDTGQAAVIERSTIEWKDMGGAFVPVEFKTQYLKEDGTIDRSTRFEFNWESVNKPVPARRFDYRDFGPFPENTVIVDTRLGKPVILEIVGQTTGVANTPIPQESHRATWIAIAVGLALVGLTAAVLLMRRRRRQGAID